MNGLCDTTFPLNQNSRREPVNTQLISTNNAVMKQEYSALDCKPRNIIPYWIILGAKPTDKFYPSDKGEQVTGRTQRPIICDSCWPALSSEMRASSTPIPRRKQPWTAVKTKSKSKHNQITKIHLKNRFATLSQDLVVDVEQMAQNYMCCSISELYSQF